MGRIVLHVDMDAFYASVEERDDPSLRGVPVVVGADPRAGKGRGVACTANYAARSYGIHSAMPISQAYRACPHARFIRPDFQRYKEASRRVMEVLAQYADATPEGPMLQVVGMDEAYLDVTDRCAGEWDRVGSLCHSLQAAVRRATGLPCSVGAAPCKAVAKVASDHRKPHGVTAVTPEALQGFLDPLPVGKLHGCGPRSAALLRDQGWPTVQDLREASPALVEEVLGSHGAWLWAVAHGQDPRPVSREEGPRKSRGNESTFHEDIIDAGPVIGRMEGLLAEILAEQARDGRAWCTLTVKLRYQGFETLTRSHTFPSAMEAGQATSRRLAMETMRSLAMPLMDGRPIRLVGVRLSNFVASAGQRTLEPFGVRATMRPRRPGRSCMSDRWRGQQVLVGP